MPTSIVPSASADAGRLVDPGKPDGLADHDGCFQVREAFEAILPRDAPRRPPGGGKDWTTVQASSTLQTFRLVWLPGAIGEVRGGELRLAIARRRPDADPPRIPLPPSDRLAAVLRRDPVKAHPTARASSAAVRTASTSSILATAGGGTRNAARGSTAAAVPCPLAHMLHDRPEHRRRRRMAPRMRKATGDLFSVRIISFAG